MKLKAVIMPAMARCAWATIPLVNFILSSVPGRNVIHPLTAKTDHHIKKAIRHGRVPSGHCHAL